MKKYYQRLNPFTGVLGFYFQVGEEVAIGKFTVTLYVEYANSVEVVENYIVFEEALDEIYTNISETKFNNKLEEFKGY